MFLASAGRFRLRSSDTGSTEVHKGRRTMKHLVLAAGFGLVATSASAETWDMPTPYGDATFHTQNIIQFAEEVREATDGALEITIHSAG